MTMSADMTARTIMIAGDGGDEIEAYLVSPEQPSTRGGVVVIHHMPGWDRATKEMTRRFAEMGYDAICPNLYWREAPGASPDDAAAAVRAGGGVPDSRLIGDVAGAAAHLRSLPSSNGKAGVIGYCSGGRQSVLAACDADLDAAVDCYGAYVLGTPPPEFPVQARGIEEHLPNLRCPLLGLFGNDDVYPGPDEVNKLEELLLGYGKSVEFHRYDDAAHAFFFLDRPAAFRPFASADGWERIAAFYATHLAS
jgi:carboxymethylenebutenolidase